MKKLSKDTLVGIYFVAGVSGLLGGTLYLSNRGVREFIEKQEAEASVLLNEKKILEGRVIAVDEEKIPREIGGGLAGRSVIFLEKEYLRVKSNDNEYDLIAAGTTPLQVGDSLCAKYFNKQTLEDMATNSMIYSVSGHDGLFSRDFLNLAVSSKVDGLIFDYRRIK